MISWLKFEWALQGLPAEGVSNPFTLRRAQKSDEEIVLKVASSALSIDSGWGEVRKFLEEGLTSGVTRALDRETSDCLALFHGGRIIGISVLNSTPEAENHLVTGPCILHEYRSRGLGTQLLLASLLALREAGLQSAKGLARDRTTLARFVYPKFGGQALPWKSTSEPKLAA